MPERLDSTCPELHSDVAQRIGREGTVTVWDDLGRYVGRMGVNLWKYLLTVEGRHRSVGETMTHYGHLAGGQE